MPFQLKSNNEFKQELINSKSKIDRYVLSYAKNSLPDISFEYKKTSSLKKFNNKNEITVLQINLRSLIKNFPMVEELINDLRMAPHIIAISET